MHIFSTRAALLAFTSVGALLAFPMVVSAQNAAVQEPDTTEIDEVIVTGTRVAGRTRLDTIAPVDVISSETLERQGSTELAQGLANLAPSISFSRPSITDGTDTVRPATLRGLAPDQTLVLVNGTRRHSSALVNVNGSIGRGSAAVDLNAIPSIAIDRVEVLREGASAQYGSDAIAGVINLRLREARSGGAAVFTLGQYFTDFATARLPSRSEEDGQTFTAAGWQGLPLGEEGFLTVSAEYRDRSFTSRGDLDPRLAPRPARITSRYGDPETTDATLYLNAGIPLQNEFELYGFAGYQNREAESAATPRTWNNPNNDLAVYPEGFLPIIAPTVEDFTAGAGIKGQIAGFDMDLNLVFGSNEVAYRVEDSLNGSLVPNSPTSFDAGGLAYDQFVLGLDVVRRYDIGLFEPLNVAFGAEARREHFEIFAGELASYQFVPGRPGAGAGSQGFIGFRPSNEVDETATPLASMSMSTPR
jgi:iron complex outermembrane receptor protein